MSKFVPIKTAVDLPMLANDDYLKRDKGRLLSWAKYVYMDMNMSSMKIAIREEYQINKRTNTIELPGNTIQLCSVNLVDHCGVFYPVYRNTSLKADDIVDIPADKDCACEFKCGYKLCNLIKGYEAVVSVKSDFMPDGSAVNFTCTDRKAIDDNGFFYSVTEYPLRVYLSGVWVDTVKHQQTDKLCKVEVDEHGCCCDTETNINNICHHCGISDGTIAHGGDANCPPNPTDEKWIYYCNSKLDWFSVQCGCYPHGLQRHCNNIYNITELGDRLIFPHNFGFDKVMIRRYVDVNLNDLQIPLLSLDTFITGLKWWDCRWNDKKQPLADKYGRQYVDLKFGLLKDLNKYRIAELGKIICPPVYVPSYTLARFGNRIDSFGSLNNYTTF